MSPLRVVAGVIQRGDRYFLQQRHGRRDFPFTWESPGGKVEKDENDREALARELWEELDWREHDHGRINDTPLLVVPLTLNERNVEVSLYSVIVAVKWVPKLLDAVGCGWFTLEEMSRLPLIPGNRAFLEMMWGQLMPGSPLPPRLEANAGTP